MQRYKKNLTALCFGIIISFILLELFLRIYNPIPFRVKGNKVVLPANQKYIIKNDKISSLDLEIIHTKNSIGFRGENLPYDFSSYLSIITVGGSTTECYYLSDNKTWPYLLEEKLKKSFKNIWLNNAGLDGHSTFGHAILLEDCLVKIKPKVILFLVGINDIKRDDLNNFDKQNIKKYEKLTLKNMVEKSQVILLAINIKRILMARKRKLMHNPIDISKQGTLEVSDEAINKELKVHKIKFLPNYEKRLMKLIEVSRKNQIEPIFITQPMLWGEGKDPLTGVDLVKIKTTDKSNGALDWKVLEVYNKATINVADKTGVHVIDLAVKLPKNSAYFYDLVHMTNKGVEVVSEIIYEDLKKYFKEKYGSFIKGGV